MYQKVYMLNLVTIEQTSLHQNKMKTWFWRSSSVYACLETFQITSDVFQFSFDHPTRPEKSESIIQIIQSNFENEVGNVKFRIEKKNEK